MIFLPETEGTASIRSSSERFLQAFRERVAAGLLAGRPHPRSNYVVSEASPDRLIVRAADWWTAINVGLNTVQLRHDAPGTVRFQVQYWRWSAYVLGLGAAIGLVGLVMLLTFDVRAYIARYPGTMPQSLSIEQYVTIAWLMVVFWGFLWPWLLIALHKRPLRTLVTRLITEVDAGASAALRN